MLQTGMHIVRLIIMSVWQKHSMSQHSMTDNSFPFTYTYFEKVALTNMFCTHSILIQDIMVFKEEI